MHLTEPELRIVREALQDRLDGLGFDTEHDDDIARCTLRGIDAALADRSPARAA